MAIEYRRRRTGAFRSLWVSRRIARGLLSHALVSLLLAFALPVGFAGAEEVVTDSKNREASEVTEKDSPEAAVTEAVATIVYQPPRRGSPRGRLGGGARGARALPSPLALVPDHVALTGQAAPSLYWYVDDALPENVDATFTLLEAEGVNPLLEITLPRPAAAGIQRVRLADHGIELALDNEYEWVIAIVPNPKERSNDIITVASIRRVEEPRLEGRPATASTYAALGLWYDALQSLNEAIERAPDDASLHALRAQLFGQAGLETAVP
jgi:hypothetical protein